DQRHAGAWRRHLVRTDGGNAAACADNDRGEDRAASTRAPLFSKDGADYVVAGTASGSTRDPAWLHNLEAHPTPSVEVDGRQFEASATIAAEAGRDRLLQQ